MKSTQDGLGVIPYERHPALGRNAFPGSRVEGHVASDRPRRHSNSQFEEQLSSDALFSPCRILPSHSQNQSLNVFWHSRPAARPGFPSPEQAKAPPMPAEESIGFDDDQGIPPRKEPREQNQRQASSVASSPGFHLALEVQGQLLAKKNVFRFEGRLRPRPEQ
jgi:hypothetical protein